MLFASLEPVGALVLVSAGFSVRRNDAEGMMAVGFDANAKL